MRTAAAIVIFSTVVFAQGFINNLPLTGGSFGAGSFGNVVFPGATSATTPGTLRTFGNVVFPGGGGPSPIVPTSNAPVAGRNFVAQSFGVSGGGRSFGGSGGGRSFGGSGGGRRRSSGTTIIPYAYPVYIGGYGYVGGSYYADPSAYGDPSAGAPYGAAPYGSAPAQQGGNVTVIYPPASPPPQPPVMMNPNGPNGGQTTATMPGMAPMLQPGEPAQAASPAGGASHYLIAFKDRTIYSAVAYWVDGDTLHYFTTGSTHNQVSLSLVDIPLTERLNKEAGEDIRLR